MLSHLKNALEAEGIECALRGEHLLGGVGELPPIECWPGLWVDDEQAVLARSHVAALIAPVGEDAESWDCAACGEESPGAFTDCWSCGAARSELNQAH